MATASLALSLHCCPVIRPRSMATASLAFSLRLASSSRRSLTPPCSTSSTPSVSACASIRAVMEEESKFQSAAVEGCNLLPLTRCIFSDHLTLVLAYLCLVKEDDREAPSFLFESVEQGSDGTNAGRYNVVGVQPAMEIVDKANLVTVMDHEMKSRREHFVPDPIKIPRTIMEQWNPKILEGLPDAFCGTIFPLPVTLDLE